MRMIRAAVLALLLISACTALFAQQSEPLPSLSRRSAGSAPIHYRQDTVSNGSYSGIGAAAILLVALAVLALQYGKKRGVRIPLKGLRNERLKLVEVLHLSGRSRIYLVEVDGERLVIGEQQNGINVHPLPKQ